MKYKRKFLTMILLSVVSTYSLASPSELQKEQLLKNCIATKKCEMIVTGWMYGPSNVNVYVKNDVIKKINDLNFIGEYYSKIIVAKRNQPVELLRLDRNIGSNIDNAPMINNNTWMNNVSKTNKITLLKYDPEIVLKTFEIK